MSNFLDLIEENYNNIKRELDYLSAQGNTIYEFCLEGKIAYKNAKQTPEYKKLEKLSAKMKKLTNTINHIARK